jgi:Holliday junction DNA helicase RuvA
MIGFLQGRIISKKVDAILLLVGGVGYQLECPASTLWMLPKEGEAAALYVSTFVREDAIRLFGFVTEIDKRVFETLIGVSSVGPKLALALLGPLSGEELVLALHEKDETKLLAVPGVGQRKLEKLLVEMGPKIERLWAACQHADLVGQSMHSVNRSSVEEGGTGVDDAEGGFVDEHSRGASSINNSAMKARSHRNELLKDLESALTNIGHREKFIKPCLDWIQEQWKSGAVATSLEESLRMILQRQSARLVTREESPVGFANRAFSEDEADAID